MLVGRVMGDLGISCSSIEWKVLYEGGFGEVLLTMATKCRQLNSRACHLSLGKVSLVFQHLKAFKMRISEKCWCLKAYSGEDFSISAYKFPTKFESSSSTIHLWHLAEDPSHKKPQNRYWFSVLGGFESFNQTVPISINMILSVTWALGQQLSRRRWFSITKKTWKTFLIYPTFCTTLQHLKFNFHSTSPSHL